MPVADPVVPEGTRCGASDSNDPDSGTQPEKKNLVFEIGQSGQEPFRSATTGEEFELIAGGQGATMIIYDMRVMLSTSAESLCAQLRDEAGSLGLFSYYELKKVSEGIYRSGPVYHPLGFTDPEEFVGEIALQLTGSISALNLEGSLERKLMAVNNE